MVLLREARKNTLWLACDLLRQTHTKLAHITQLQLLPGQKDVFGSDWISISFQQSDHCVHFVFHDETNVAAIDHMHFLKVALALVTCPDVYRTAIVRSGYVRTSLRSALAADQSM